LSLEEAQNRANESLLSGECSISQLHADLELSSDTTEDESKAKAKPVRRPKHPDVEPSNSDAEAPTPKPKTDKGQSADPIIVLPEIVAEFHESIVISEEENGAEPLTSSASILKAPPASTSATPPVPTLMAVHPPVPLATDIFIPLRKPSPSKPHTPVAKLRTELSSPEPLPRTPEVIRLTKKRTKKLSNLHLANATLNFRKSSKDIAEDFAVTYQLNADAKHQTQREIAKMRLAQKALAIKLRTEFPVSCKSEHSRQAFLEKFDSTTQCV